MVWGILKDVTQRRSPVDKNNVNMANSMWTFGAVEKSDKLLLLQWVDL